MLVGPRSGLVSRRRNRGGNQRIVPSDRGGLAADRPTLGNDVGEPGDPASGVGVVGRDERFGNNRLASLPRIG